MKRYRRIVLVRLMVGVAVAVSTVFAVASSQAASPCNTMGAAFCFSPHITQKLDTLDSVQVPKIATPAWLGTQDTMPIAKQVSYTIATRGTITADVDEFATQVNETLNSPLGWSRLGVSFGRVESGGQFIVWLSDANQMTSFSASGCDAMVSCTVGNNVIINQTRWLNGSDAWNNAGGSLRNYRHMVVNHETGHWLGHGHEYCAGSGQDAPVMQQQTIDLQGCKPNPWPLANELYAPKLGIRS